MNRLSAALLFLAGTVLLLLSRMPQQSPGEQSSIGQASIGLAQRRFLKSPLPQDAAAAAATVNEARLPELDFEAHAGQRRQQYGDRFTVIVEKPFVVIGDGPAENVNRWATGTIRWAVKQIKAIYFEKEPDHIIDIWLFQNRQSYETNTKAIFGSVPGTPYGYYSPSDKALVMNISTGGGTLVHEIVHPFMAANFEECPSWFNEGLASLYEQSGEREGKIVGHTNWRLRALQLAIKDDLLGSLEKLMTTSDREFYDGDSTNYAQARYLCYWLQQNDLLEKYYDRFSANVAEDPSGIETLKQLIEQDELVSFQKKWEQQIVELRSP